MIGKCRGIDDTIVDVDASIARKEIADAMHFWDRAIEKEFQVTSRRGAFLDYCALLPRGVRGMTYDEFCADVAEGLR